MTLENTFYTLGIITMSLSLLLLIALVVAVFAIRAKINALHDAIYDKVNMISSFARKSAAAARVLKKVKGAR